MAIIDLQRGIAEAGRIRIGQQVPIGNGRTRPEKLGTFRFTSPDRRRIEEAAQLFGGTVEPWEAPAGKQWEVITETAEIEVIVPPSAMAFSQHYELWSAGGCQRRCDGATEMLSEQPCLCDPEERACDIHSRLSVMIRDLPGLALWRLDTQGFYAARELAGAVEILAMAAGRGLLLPARLLLEQRSVKRPGKNGRPQTLRFAVPRLDPGITPGELLASSVSGVPLQIAAETRPLLTPVPPADGPQPTIAEQSAPPPQRAARRNAAPAIPSSGRQRAAARSEPKTENDEGYWRARAFADGAERGIDADKMRALAAELLGVSPEGFSMAELDEDEWERIHGVINGFPPLKTAQETAEDTERTPAPPEPAGGQGAAAAAATDVDDGDFTLPDEDADPDPVSYEVFKDSVHAAGIPGVTLQATFHRLHGTRPAAAIRDELTDEQRGALLAAVVADHERNALTA